MYWRRFNLTGEPFSLTPDPAFLYLSSVHAEAYAALTMGLRERRGLISMIGEVGTGKTTLVYSLLSSLGPEIHTAYISNARLSFDGILRSALRDFGVECEDLHGVQLLDAFNDFLHRCARDGTTAALVIDEAQNLSHDTFEDLRLLSNFETYKTKLLQILLVGQPELDTKLRDPALRQVAERIAVRCHVNPLTAQETRHYIEHRLSAVGGSIDVFSEPAIRTIISRSAGIPRAVNILCHNAMLFAYGQAKDKIARSMVLEAVHEKEGGGLVRLGSRPLGSGLPGMSGFQLSTPAWTWNAVFLILAVGLSVAMIRVAGNIRFAPAQPQAPVLSAAPLPVAEEVEPFVAEQMAAPVVEQAQAVIVDESAHVAEIAIEQQQHEVDARQQIAQPELPAEPLVAIEPGPLAVVAAEPQAPAAEHVIESESVVEPVAQTAGLDIPDYAENLVEEPLQAAQARAEAPVEIPAAPTEAQYEVAATQAAAEVAAEPIAAQPVFEQPVDASDPLGYAQDPPSAGARAILTEPIEAELAQALEIELGTAAAARPDDTTLALLNAEPPQLTDPSSYQIIDVEPGNSLSDLMIAIYGHYTNTMVQRVQALNPQITDPNVILAGDELRFPSDWEASPSNDPEQQR